MKNAKTKKSDVATATFRMKDLTSDLSTRALVGTYFGSMLSYDPRKPDGAQKNGVLTVTVAATGKISGFYAVLGSKVSFSGTGISWNADGEPSATVKGKVGKSTVSFALVFKSGEAVFSGKISKSVAVKSERLLQNPWKTVDVASRQLPELVSGLVASTALTGYLNGKAQKGTLKLAFGSQGAVTATFTVPKKGSVTGSLQITDVEKVSGGWNCTLVVGVAPNAKKGIAGVYGYLSLELVEGADGKVGEVVVSADEWGPFFLDFGVYGF